MTALAFWAGCPPAEAVLSMIIPLLTVIQKNTERKIAVERKFNGHHER
jgi:NADH:ubiquinone oxidoreductase subunit B-like Fe-S oxidoreductase